MLLALYSRHSKFGNPLGHLLIARDVLFRERGHVIFTQAHAILDKPRGSPTAKDKVLPLIEVAKKYPMRSEDEFASHILETMLNEARMVPKKALAPGQILTTDDFKPDPRAWGEDYLGEWPCLFLSFPGTPLAAWLRD